MVQAERRERAPSNQGDTCWPSSKTPPRPSRRGAVVAWSGAPVGDPWVLLFVMIGASGTRIPDRVTDHGTLGAGSVQLLLSTFPSVDVRRGSHAMIVRTWRGD